MLPGEPSAEDKMKALQGACCAIVNHPSRFAPVLKSMLDGLTTSGHNARSPLSGASFQHRGIHTSTRTQQPLQAIKSYLWQTRSIYLTQSTSLELLRQRGLLVVDSKCTPGEGRLLAVTLNRSTSSPCIIASPSTDSSPEIIKRFDYDYEMGAEGLHMNAIASHLGIDGSNSEVISSLHTIVTGLVALFAEKEAYLLETHLVASQDATPKIGIVAARFGFDDAAYRIGSRQADIQALRDTSVEDASELEAERYGIVHIKLPNGKGEGETANIGTLVNGAGLAMNTVDALAHVGGRAANFLDTGGKATSETVKKSFEVILKDPRVKVSAALLVVNKPFPPSPFLFPFVPSSRSLLDLDGFYRHPLTDETYQCIFVNIFGGLTLGDMIARGIILAFRDLHMSVPVVVRIRGTNEKEGQRIIAESGLPLFAFDDFDEAARKAVELANARN